MNDKLVVVVGAARKLGRLVVGALLAHPDVRVRALVRDPSKPDVASLASERVELVAFDATGASEAQRGEAVRGAYAVVSTLQGGPDVIVDAQLALLRAAKAAGARRFIPSDYSYVRAHARRGTRRSADARAPRHARRARAGDRARARGRAPEHVRLAPAHVRAGCVRRPGAPRGAREPSVSRHPP